MTALRGEPEKAVEALRTFRKEGPWNLAAIPPDGGSIEFASFQGAAQVPALLKWIEDRDGVKNVYWSPNPTRAPVSRKPKKGDIGSGRTSLMLIVTRCPERLRPMGSGATARHWKTFQRRRPPSSTPETAFALCGGSIAR